LTGEDFVVRGVVVTAFLTDGVIWGVSTVVGLPGRDASMPPSSLASLSRRDIVGLEKIFNFSWFEKWNKLKKQIRKPCLKKLFQN
jgi:hypothetical protein